MGTYPVTNQASYEALPSTTSLISEARCAQDGVEKACNAKDEIDNMPSDGFEIHGSGETVGDFELVFAGSATVEVEYTREGTWNKNCDVEMLKNEVTVGSVPLGESNKDNDRTKTTTTVVNGDILALREGTDKTACGVHIYSVKITCPE